MLVLGFEDILSSHVPTRLEDQQLGVVAGRVHAEQVSSVDFLLERE